MQIPRTVLDVSVLSDDDLIQKIRSWGGTPKALTENKDMMKIAVRVLRADLTLLHNYRCGHGSTSSKYVVYATACV